jgi:hypothetical protein
MDGIGLYSASGIESLGPGKDFMLAQPQNSQKSPIFGLQYIEEEEANLLDVVGCTGLSGGTGLESVPSTPSTPALTIKLCGDGFDVSDMELSP